MRQTVDQAVNVKSAKRAKREALLAYRQRSAWIRAGSRALLERALPSLWMAFQPILRVFDKSVFGYEALLRAIEPALPGPGSVIYAAERLGQLGRLGRITRERARLRL